MRTPAVTLNEGSPSEVSAPGLEQPEKQLNGQAETTVSDSNDPLRFSACCSERPWSLVGAMITCDYPQCSVMLLATPIPAVNAATPRR